MSLLHVLIVLIVVGVLLWLVNLIPMAEPIRSIINAVVVIIVVFWLMKIFGILTFLSSVRVGR